MNPALRLGLGVLMIGLAGLASGCSSAAEALPPTARLEFAKQGLPYKAAVHEFYAWRPTAQVLLALHGLTLVDTNDATYVVTIDVRNPPNASAPALSVANIGLNPKRPNPLASTYVDKDKEYSPRFNRPMHESFKLAEALERTAQLTPATSP